MRKLPLFTRRGLDASSSPEAEIGLFRISHAPTNAVVRLCTASLERLSVEPLAYGTRSKWLTENPAEDPFKLVLLSALLPDDKEEGPGAGQIVMDAADDKIVRLLRSFTTQARVDIAIVRAADPDTAIEQWLHYELMQSEVANDQVTISFSRDRMTGEPWPFQRMNRSSTPGLHR